MTINNIMDENLREISREEIIKLNQHFEDKLQDIESQHQSWFDNRDANKDGIGPKLEDHCSFYLDGSKYHFGYAPGSDLPDFIKGKCLKAFKEVFA